MSFTMPSKQKMPSTVKDILNYDLTLADTVRAFTGAYYTPLSIAQTMIEDAVCFYLQNLGYKCADVDDFMAAKASALAAEILDLLSRAKLIDMASGTGVFGFAWLSALDKLHRQYELASTDQYLQRAMRGIVLNDCNAASVEQFSALLKRQFGLDFKGTILSVDALSELAMQPAVKKVVDDGGFDIVIGNPPYIGERGHTDLFAPLKDDAKWSKYYMGKMDYSYFFVHQGLDFLSKNGVMTQIMTSYFMTADGAQKLRKDLQQRATWQGIRYYDKLDEFHAVKNLSFVIFSVTQKRDADVICRIQRNAKRFSASNRELYSAVGHIQLIPPADNELLSRIEQRARYKLTDLCHVNQGLVSGADRLKRKHCKMLNIPYEGERPIFVFKADECGEDEQLKPFLKNSDIGSYQLAKAPTQRILYSVADNLRNRPQWLEHLAPYRAILSRRREVKAGVRKWYELQWPRAESIFLAKKIVAPQRASRNCFAYVETPVYGSADIYFITLKHSLPYAEVDEAALLKALTMYLNSSVVYLWLNYKGKRKGAQFELYASPLRQIPVPAFSAQHVDELANCYQLYIAGDEAGAIARSEQIINCYFGFEIADNNN